MDLIVRSTKRQNLLEFLEDEHYLVEQVSPRVLAISTVGGPNIYIAREQDQHGNSNHEDLDWLYFELNLGKLGLLAKNATVLNKLLDLNSEIAPVSVAINSEGVEPELVLVERLQSSNLDSNEILSIIEAMGLAYLRVSKLLD